MLLHHLCCVYRNWLQSDSSTLDLPALCANYTWRASEEVGGQTEQECWCEPVWGRIRFCWSRERGENLPKNVMRWREVAGTSSGWKAVVTYKAEVSVPHGLSCYSIFIPVLMMFLQFILNVLLLSSFLVRMAAYVALCNLLEVCNCLRGTCCSYICSNCWIKILIILIETHITVSQKGQIHVNRIGFSILACIL